ncbi:hypothetical protein [Jannaschia sp. W003]|uniref:hypothetical protein n=1 Tax=Jannaschia sp. W003 TaxID=2867012 RepID=UPI0021A417D3|nr:hypothetical protein [Jannaschia sp. W003]UWQ21665.1 hypothetical protein K3554_01140 [Jannaschia sp. W003]
MGKHWIIEVLGDLRIFADANDLPCLARRLEEVAQGAEEEIARAAPAETEADDTADRGLLRSFG